MTGEAVDGAAVIKKVKIALNVEGPYGIPSIDLASGVYTVFLLIGGGIGEKDSQISYFFCLKFQRPEIFIFCIFMNPSSSLSLFSAFYRCDTNSEYLQSSVTQILK